MHLHKATERLDLPHCQTSTAAQFGAFMLQCIIATTYKGPGLYTMVRGNLIQLFQPPGLSFSTSGAMYV